MSFLVSIIIPCYNSERWVRQTVESCLNQTHQAVEVIALDDGSTDNSLEILRSFGSRIKVEAGANRGANVARNRGIAIARGEFIQFLDADDYLEPQKIANQVSFLASTGADIVYGDWRYQFHEPDGSIRMGKINIPGHLADPLESLLSGWFVPPNAYLFCAKKVLAGGGWDETLKRGQDTDFMICLAQAGAKFGYQPGCGAVYRSYKDEALFWSPGGGPWDEHFKVLQKAEKRLEAEDKLTPRYRSAMACLYFFYAKAYFERNRERFWEFIAEGMRLDPNAVPYGSRSYKFIAKLFGFGFAERIASLKRHIIKRPAPQ